MTKKRAKAKTEPDDTPQDELNELLGMNEPDENEEPSAEPVQAEEEPEETETTPTELEEEPEEPSEEDQERIAAEAAQKSEEEREKREKGLRDEITRLRESNQRLKAEREAFQRTPQAPIPGQVPSEQQWQYPYPQPGAQGTAVPPQGQAIQPQQMPGMPQPGAPQFQVPVSFDGDTPAVDLTPVLSAYEARMQQLEQSMRPDPARMEAEAIARARTEWVGTDPQESAVRSQAAQRMEKATELLSYKFDEYVAKTGYQPRGFDQVVEMIDRSEIGDTLRTHFPEITNTAEFVDAFFMPVPDPSVRIWKLRNYMDRHIQSQRSQQEQGEEPQSSEQEQVSNVVRIPDKPRSMAAKGQGAAAAMTDKQRFSALGDQIGKDVFVPDEDYKEYARLGKKLGIEGF